MVDASAVAGVAKSIATSLIEEGKYLYGVEDKVRSLQSDLECMLEFLQNVDANPHLVKEDGQLRIFTHKMRELAFRAEDAIDTFLVDVGSKINMKNLFSKLISFVSRSYPLHMLRNEIEAIQQEIQEAKRRFKTFGIITHPPKPYSRSSPEYHIHLEDEFVVGIDDDINKLVKFLTKSEHDFRVLGIVGTGGAGKTTLATKLYHHREVTRLFSYKAFVSVSQQWSRFDLLHRIFKQVMRNIEIPTCESDLVKELHDYTKDKQCLLVLDDIWKEEAWDNIYSIFPQANKGFKVVITTRIEEIPLYADNECIIHRPRMLTKDQKWILFKKLAMKGRENIETNPEFEKLGRDMLAKCQGLPLIVVTLAGILRMKRELSQWENVSKACNEYILKGKGTHSYGVVEDMMELSYLDLPTDLKPCFLYLTLFPEDHDIMPKNLIPLWIAEGFITNDRQNRHERQEEIAMRLVDELAQRCILQVTKRNFRGQIEVFRLHDLMRELCIKKGKEYRFLEIVSSSSPDARGSGLQPRRTTTYHRYNPEKNDHLRTFAYIGLDPNEIVTWNLEFKLLRVLHIYNGVEVFLPEQIGNLIHLRYLSILGFLIIKLPKSIKNLRNLVHFEIWYVEKGRVPNDLVRNMKQLRVLILHMVSTSGYRVKKLGLSGPKNLNRLSCGAGIWMTTELPTLSPSVQELKILGVQKKKQMEVIYGCSSIKEDCLTILHISSDDSSVEFDLRMIEHCEALQTLFLACPLAENRVGTIMFPLNLVTLKLVSSKIQEKEDLMKVLGELTKLKSLSLVHDAYLGTQLCCTGSDFPELRELTIDRLENLREWRMGEGAMARLTMLKIYSCRKLVRLPESIRSITTLKELELWMPSEFCRRLGHGGSSIEGVDSYIIQHIPSVTFSVY